MSSNAGGKGTTGCGRGKLRSQQRLEPEAGETAKWVRVACYTSMRTQVRIPGTHVKAVSTIPAGGVEMGGELEFADC